MGLGHLEILLRLLRKCGCSSLICMCIQAPEEEIEEIQDAPPKPFRNMPPPVLPLNFKEIPVLACLKEIKVRMAAMEELLKDAHQKASAALGTFERSG